MTKYNEFKNSKRNLFTDRQVKNIKARIGKAVTTEVKCFICREVKKCIHYDDYHRICDGCASSANLI